MIKKSMIAGAVALGCAGVQAASANLTVTGTISPEACSISLGGGSSATVDLGQLKTSAVKAPGATGSGTPVYFAGTGSSQLKVVCASPTALALHWIDNKSASVIKNNELPQVNFGLGSSSGKNIGGYGISTTSANFTTTDAGPAIVSPVYLYAPYGTSAWVNNDIQAVSKVFRDGGLFGFATKSSDTIPASIVTATIDLFIVVYVSKSLVDTSASEIKLDGSSTVSLEYL